MARMPSSRPRGGRVIVLLMAALPWKASCMNQQHTDQSSHHLEGNLSLLPSIAHLLGRTAVDLCSRMPLLAFSFGRAALDPGAVPHIAGVSLRACNVWMQTARRYAVLFVGEHVQPCRMGGQPPRKRRACPERGHLSRIQGTSRGRS